MFLHSLDDTYNKALDIEREIMVDKEEEEGHKAEPEGLSPTHSKARWRTCSKPRLSKMYSLLLQFNIRTKQEKRCNRKRPVLMYG